jgi:hypothetical protein
MTVITETLMVLEQFNSSSFFLDVVPGDVSFMGQETKSLDVMTGKSLPASNDQPIPPHDVSTDPLEESTVTHETSTITHEGSTTTNEVSTLTYEESTLNEQSTTYEHSITSPELSGSEVRQTGETVNLSQSTPKQTSSMDVEAVNKDSVQIVSQEQGTVVFTVEDDHTDGRHPNSSDDVPNISDDIPSISGRVLKTFDFKPSTSDDVPNTSDNISNTSDDVMTTSDVPNISDRLPSTSNDVPEILITAADSDDALVDSNECGSTSNGQEISVSGNNEVVEENSNVENSEIDYKRRSSTDSDPSVVDSKI